MYVCMHHITHLDVCTYTGQTVETKTRCHTWIMSPICLYICICVTQMDVCMYARDTMGTRTQYPTYESCHGYEHMNIYIICRTFECTCVCRSYDGDSNRCHTYESCHPYDCISVWMCVCMQVARLGQERDVICMNHVTCMNHVKHMNIWTYEPINIWMYECMNVCIMSHMWMHVCMQVTRWGHELDVTHMNHVTYESCHIFECMYVCIMSDIWIHVCMQVTRWGQDFNHDHDISTRSPLGWDVVATLRAHSQRVGALAVRRENETERVFLCMCVCMCVL